MSRRFVVGVLLVVWGASAGARTLRVPADYPTIRNAAFEAGDGDTVLVGPGTYRDRLTIWQKNIVLRGEMGADATVIDGSVGIGNVITLVRNTRSMILEDLTITGGSFNPASPECTGAAVYINHGDATVQRCKMIQNQGSAVGGVDVYFFSRPLIRDCFIARNKGGGIIIETDTGEPGPAAELYNNTVVHNTGYGIGVIKGARAIIENNTVAYNTGDGIRSEITLGSGDGKCFVTVRNSIVTHNAGGGIVRRETLGACYTLECNDVWGNAGVQGGVIGNYQGYSTGDGCFGGRGAGDVSFDPVYRNAAGDDFRLAPESPLFTLCVPGSCGVLGAGNECTNAVEAKTWSAVKLLYR